MLLDTILNDLSLERAWAHLEWLDREAPSRVSGTPGQERAAEYFAECLARYGLNARLETFAAYRSVPIRGALEVVAPTTVRRVVACEACGHIRSTPEEGLVVDVVAVGVGAESDYAGKRVDGHAVLADISAGPPRPEKARIAARHGAAAIVFVNWGLAEFGTIPRGAIKCAWGNPTRASIADVPQIAAIGISRGDGEALQMDLARGPVTVRIVAQATRDWGPLSQPWGRLRAPNGDGTVLIVGGHHDAWKPGMTDHGAGNALMLELARALAGRSQSLQRDVIVAFWNGHEIGDYEGSTWFADRYWDELDRDAVAYFNVDSVGLAHTSHYLGDSTPELRRFHLEVEHDVLQASAGHRRLTRDNEHPFFPLGLPALEGRFHFSDQQIEEWGHARGSWWWHSDADTLDKIDRVRFEDTLRVYAGYAWAMCVDRLLPMEFTAWAEDIARRVELAERSAAGRLELNLPVAPFQQAVTELARLTPALARSGAQSMARANRAMMKISRMLLPAFETFGGRYDQDRVSHNALSSPIPALHDLALFGQTPLDSELHHLLATELLRQRNRVSDALRAATDVIHELLDAPHEA